MTCLTVSSSIQPISAPTGMDADMGENDKLTPSIKLAHVMRTDRRRSARLLLGSFREMRLGLFSFMFMTSPGADCTTRAIKKSGMSAESVGITASANQSEAVYLHSTPMRISSVDF